MNAPIRINTLTLAERVALEQEFDGPIPPQAVADKLAQRPASPLSADQLRSLLRTRMEDLAYRAECVKLAVSPGEKQVQESLLATAQAEVDRLDDQLAAVSDVRVAAE